MTGIGEHWIENDLVRYLALAQTDLAKQRPDLTPGQVRCMAMDEAADFFQIPMEEVEAELEAAEKMHEIWKKENGEG